MRRACLVAVLLLSVPASAQAAGGPLLGVQDDALLSSGEPAAWPLAARLAPAVIRFNVAWNAVAPTRPAAEDDPGDAAYRFEAVDRVVRRAAAIGAAPLLTLVQSPTWANGVRAPASAPLDAAAYGRFCRAVARRYSGTFTPAGADAPLPAVQRFTVWNEPNRGQYLQPQGSGGLTAPRTEARLVRACTAAVRGANPDARVALGPLASRGAQGGLAPLAFLAAYRRAGGPRPDAIALNPYLDGLAPVYRPRELAPDGAITLRNLTRLKSWTRAVYHRSVPLWLTEFAVRVGPAHGGRTVTASAQASQAARSLRLVRTHYPYVELLVWFLLRDESAGGYWRSGLATFSWRPRPVLAVWR